MSKLLRGLTSHHARHMSSTRRTPAFWTPKPVEPIAAQSHSSQMSDSHFIYELVEHKVHPGHMAEFLGKYESYMTAVQTAVPSSELVASLRTTVGDVDSTVHIVRHRNGFEDVDRHLALAADGHLAEERDAIGRLCRHRESSLIKSFSYWGDVTPRDPTHIYDLRRYVLKPGQMIEWANNWVKGITYRREANQDVGGWFTQVGSLYVVYHLWAYESMEHRKKVRENTWSREGWDQTVAYTVPLIVKMKSQIMLPTSYSPLK